MVRKDSVPDPLVRGRDSALWSCSGVDTGLVYRPPDFYTEEGSRPGARLDHGRGSRAVGIFFTWRGQRQAREAQEENQKNTQAQLRHAQEELSLTRQGQITERFTRAIDQLGHARTEIRLGGIYALERIARESEEDHWPIMESGSVLLGCRKETGRARRMQQKRRTPWTAPGEVGNYRTSRSRSRHPSDHDRLGAP